MEEIILIILQALHIDTKGTTAKIIFVLFKVFFVIIVFCVIATLLSFFVK
jgi:hypothetical protein